MRTPLTATVVGGGISGLAAATALVRAGWQVTVLERAGSCAEVGAGLAITGNGMAALDVLGLGGRVRAEGYPTFATGIQDADGRWLLHLAEDPESMTRAWGVHRQRLHNALLASAEGAELLTGVQVTHVRPGDSRALATTTGRGPTGEHTIESDLVVAADGVRSTVRAALFPDVRLDYSGYTSWRAVIADSSTARDGFVAAWGPRTEFGAVRLSTNQLYWYGYFHHPAGAAFPDEFAAATEHFSAWAPWVRSTVAATSPTQLMRHDVYHLPGGLPTYVRGRVVMIGDAAHAMLPTMGQGANTSLEDAVCVGQLIAEPAARGHDLVTALAAFDQARRPRCRRIAQRSLLTARLGAYIPGGLPQSLRNPLVRLTPPGPMAKAGAEVLRWTPPQPAS